MTTAIRCSARCDVTAGEVIAAIDHLIAGSTRIAEREKLARLRQVVAQKHPRPS
jgi:hypothetical protein